MPKNVEALRNKYAKIRGNMDKEVARARIDGDPEAILRAAEAFSQNVIDSVLAFEDQHWQLLSGAIDENGNAGLSHNQVKEVAKQAKDMTKMNAFMGHALRVKTNHIFGRGFAFDLKPPASKEAIAPRHQKIIDDAENQRVIFSPTAMRNLNRVLWNTGNLFVLYNEKEREFSILSVDKAITPEFIHFDDNPSRLKYFKRSYTRRRDINTKTVKAPETVEEWVPVLEYKEYKKRRGEKIPGIINVGGQDEIVNTDCVVIDLRLNKDEDEMWGVPDSFAAIPWAWASAEYIKDGSKLLKAYAAIAYQIKTKGEAGKKAAGAAIASGKVGGSAVTGLDTEISQVNRASAVDLYTGRPIQAMFASAVDLSVTSVTNDTGKGGAYGSEQVLTTPEVLAALSRQEDFSGFFARLFRAMGIEGRISWPSPSQDPVHRQLQSLGLAYTLGGIFQEELRVKSLELLDIEGDPTELPEPNAFTGSKIASLSVDPDPDAEDPIPAQGNSGAVGALADGDNELRDED